MGSYDAHGIDLGHDALGYPSNLPRATVINATGTIDFAIIRRATALPSLVSHSKDRYPDWG